MRRIVLGTVIMVVTASLALGGVMAAFSDTETSSGNSVTAGTLDLRLRPVGDGAASDSITGQWQWSNIKPGDGRASWSPCPKCGSESLQIRNTGSIGGYVDLSNILVTSGEGENPEAETNIVAPGDLADALKVIVYFDRDGNGQVAQDTYIYFTFPAECGICPIPAPLSGIAGAYDLDYYLAPGATVLLAYEANLPYAANNNDVQGDTATISFTVELDQNPD